MRSEKITAPKGNIARGQALGRGDQVGLHAEFGEGGEPVAEAAETGDDFIAELRLGHMGGAAAGVGAGQVLEKARRST